MADKNRTKNTDKQGFVHGRMRSFQRVAGHQTEQGGIARIARKKGNAYGKGVKGKKLGSEEIGFDSQHCSSCSS